jgi:hypothetical protein
MTYMQVVISREAAYETIKQLGLLSGCGHPGLEFTDLNFTKTQFQRHYAPYIKRCLEIDRILRLLGSMVAKYRIAAEYVGDAAEETRGLFDGGAQGREPIESELFSLEGELVTMEKNLDIVTAQSVKLSEHMEVLRKVGPILGGRGGGRWLRRRWQPQPRSLDRPWTAGQRRRRGHRYKNCAVPH